MSSKQVEVFRDWWAMMSTPSKMREGPITLQFAGAFSALLCLLAMNTNNGLLWGFLLLVFLVGSFVGSSMWYHSNATSASRE